MNITRHAVTILALFSLVIIGMPTHVLATDVPAVLPAPDGKPGDASKPVKVYILAGQSNMVGMGDLSGAKNIYSGVYLSSDPSIPEAPLSIYKVGNFSMGRLSVYLSDGTPTRKPVAEGLLQVTQTGVYQLHCGFEASSFCAVELDGKRVYLREPGNKPVKQEVTLLRGKRYPFKISGLQGEPPRFWLQKTDLLGNGDLEAVARREGKFPWLVDDQGDWSVRKDVYFQEARIAKEGKGSLLSATSNGKSIGPELGFGHVMGEFHDEQVLLIKTAMGNRSLGFDFRPPSSGRTDPDSEWESAEYKLMVEGVRSTLEKIDKVVPGYKGQGYELAGFVWWQGHKDSGTEEAINEYEQNLVNLINDVRQEFDVPKLPAVIATVGFGGHNMSEKFLRILRAQLAVGNSQRHPKFAGTVSSVDTRDFWREVGESPKSQDYHYNRNAETYMLVGDALGRAMVGLLGGKAEPLPLEDRPKLAAQSAPTERSAEEEAAMQQALRPIILDGIAASYVADARNSKLLLQEASGERPERENQFLRGATFGLANCYRAAGIDDYDWHSFGPDLRNEQWEYFSFDPPEVLPEDKGNRYRQVTYPAGMQNWFAPDFDVSGAGWKSGLPPFGQLGGELEPLSDSCTAPFCGCSRAPRSLWDKEVLLIRGAFEFPPLKDGHRYRIVVGGSAHVNSGEGYALYINGRLLAESKSGVAVRQGGQPRGAYIYNDFRDDFKNGKVTIAATSFLRLNHPRTKPYPPRGHFTVWLEEQKLPPLAKALVGDP